MKVKTKEFYDLMNEFERWAKTESISLSFEKEAPGAAPKGYFYAHGKTNDLFRAFLGGYSLAKCMARTDSLPLDD